MTENTNPGNFANRPREEVREIASKGGKASGGTHRQSDDDSQHDTSSQGGNRNPGQFEKGSEKAREAGRKGGLSS